MRTITWLSPHDAPEWFPPPEQALEEPAGLLAAGGDLSPERLVAAYRRGIFPWYSPGQPVLVVVARSARGALPGGVSPHAQPGEDAAQRRFHGLAGPGLCGRDRRLRGAARGQSRDVDHRRRCAPLISSCISLGRAHSIEIWHSGSLAGGLYGVRLGGVFFGESMFSRERDASKAALAHLVALCRRNNLAVIDCQLPSRHLESLGARTIPRGQFQALLTEHALAPGATLASP